MFIIFFCKLLWYLLNKTLWDLKLQGNDQRQGGNSNPASCRDTSHHSVDDHVPYIFLIACPIARFTPYLLPSLRLYYY